MKKFQLEKRPPSDVLNLCLPLNHLVLWSVSYTYFPFEWRSCRLVWQVWLAWTHQTGLFVQRIALYPNCWTLRRWKELVLTEPIHDIWLHRFRWYADRIACTTMRRLTNRLHHRKSVATRCISAGAAKGHFQTQQGRDHLWLLVVVSHLPFVVKLF